MAMSSHLLMKIFDIAVVKRFMSVSLPTSLGCLPCATLHLE